MDDLDMSATDIFVFDVKAAKLTYLLNKRKRNEPVVLIDVPKKVREMFDAPGFDPFDPTQPSFLRRQAD